MRSFEIRIFSFYNQNSFRITKLLSILFNFKYFKLNFITTILLLSRSCLMLLTKSTRTTFDNLKMLIPILTLLFSTHISGQVALTIERISDTKIKLMATGSTTGTMPAQRAARFGLHNILNGTPTSITYSDNALIAGMFALTSNNYLTNGNPNPTLVLLFSGNIPANTSMSGCVVIDIEGTTWKSIGTIGNFWWGYNNSVIWNFDVGDYEIVASSSPEINVKGNNVSIVDGDVMPAWSDSTDLGNQGICTGTLVRTYTIENTGAGTLNVTAISTSGGQSAEFVIGGINLPVAIAANSSTTFTITFNPTALGIRSTTLNITNDDCNENPYNFSIQGTGDVSNSPILNLSDSMYYCTLAEAISASNTSDGEEIRIPAGTYMDACLMVNKSLKFTAVGGPVIMNCIEMNGSGKDLTLGSDFTFNTLTLTLGNLHTNGYNLTCGTIIGGNENSYVITD